MTAKLLTSLTADELHRYKESSLYRNSILSSYQFTDKLLDYYAEYFGSDFKNFSIAVFDDAGEPLIAVYAFSKPPVYAHFGLPVTVHEGVFQEVSQKYKAYKSLFATMNEILETNDFSEIFFYDNDYFTSEYYSKISSTDAEYCSYVNLVQTAEQLKSNLRKSYKSLVNWGEKNLTYVMVDASNQDHTHFTAFKEFHISTAGRKTRSERSWEIQYESLISDEAFLMIGYLSGNIVSGSLIFYGKKEAYYGVGVYDRELMKKNVAIGHYNVFASMLHAKKIGLETFQLGSIPKSSTDQKEVNIFRFKTGFSNTMKVLYRHTAKLKLES
ncbi:MAG: hypothetical protein ABJA57_07910 [Ginsengibacter sp.]